MKKYCFLFILILIFSLAGCAGRGAKTAKLEEISALSENHFECSYDGIKHDFIIDLPGNFEGAPLVVMLPG